MGVSAAVKNYGELHIPTMQVLRRTADIQTPPANSNSDESWIEVLVATPATSPEMDEQKFVIDYAVFECCLGIVLVGDHATRQEDSMPHGQLRLVSSTDEVGFNIERVEVVAELCA